MFRKLFTWLALGSLGLAGCAQRSDDASLRNRPAGAALAARRPEIRVYDVRDIVERDVKARREASRHVGNNAPRSDELDEQDRQKRTEELCRLVKELIEPGTWGPEGTVGALDIWNERIIARHTPAVQHRLTEVFRQVRELDDSAGSLEARFRLAVTHLRELPGAVQTLPADWHLGPPQDSYFYSSTRRYADGKPECMEVWAMGQLLERLTFHGNGHLKSEEQFCGGRISAAGYYDDSGKLLRKVQTRGWLSFVLAKPHTRPAGAEPGEISAGEPKLQVRVTARLVSTDSSIVDLVADLGEDVTARPRSSKSHVRAARLDESLRGWLQKETGITLARPAGTSTDPSTAGLTEEIAFLTDPQVEAFVRHGQAEGIGLVNAPCLTTFNAREAWLCSRKTVSLVSQEEHSKGTRGEGEAGTSLYITPTVSEDRRRVTLAVTASIGTMDGETQFVEASAQVLETVSDRDTLLIRMPIARYQVIGAREESTPDGNTATMDIVGRPVGDPQRSEGAVYLLLTPTIIVQGDIENQQFPNLMPTTR